MHPASTNRLQSKEVIVAMGAGSVSQWMRSISKKIKNANTARNVQEIILENNIDGFFDLVCSEVYKQMRDHSENKIPIEIIMFNFDENVLARYPKQQGILLN